MSAVRAFPFMICGPEPGVYAPGYPYVVGSGGDLGEAREDAQRELEPGESVGRLLAHWPSDGEPVDAPVRTLKGGDA
ncbi:MAG: hypothetical protein AAF663_02860 [Planctomycetota bacterium]